MTIHELGEVEGAPFIVMELLGGKDLDQVLKSGTPISLGQKLDIVAQLCEALIGLAREREELNENPEFELETPDDVCLVRLEPFV